MIRAGAGFAVSDRGVRVPSGLREVIDVRFDGDRVWSFNSERDRARLGRGWVLWPGDLVPYLDGVADVSLVRHTSGETLLEQRIGFGAGRGRIRVAAADGNALAIDKSGHLRRMFEGTDQALTEEVLDAVERVLHDLRQECELEAFLAYGCLLGAVRDGRMIGHDSDADVSYLSRYTHPFDIIRENKRAGDTMAALGWTITRMSAGDFKIWTRPGAGRRVGIDVFAAFYVDDVFYMIPSVTGRIDRSALLPVGTVILEGRQLVAPAQPEALLEVTYGPPWRVPDPSFTYHASQATRRRLSGWLRNNRTHLRHWNDFYRSPASGRVPTTPSHFAQWVGDRLEPRQHVLDVGCGNGRDAVHFAQLGHLVHALDSSVSARRLTRRLADQREVRVRPRELNLNDLASTLTSGAQFAHRPTPPQVYGRFLLDALEPDARLNFFRWAQMIQRRGGLTFLEFRTRRGTRRARALPFRGRDQLDPSRVVAEIEQYGGRILHQEQGSGLAPFDGEDPHTCRLIVRWT